MENTETTLLTTEQAANYLCITVKTLRNLKYSRGYDYLPYIKYSGKTLYKKDDLDEFLKIHRAKTQTDHKCQKVTPLEAIRYDIIALKEGLKEIKSILAKDDA